MEFNGSKANKPTKFFFLFFVLFSLPYGKNHQSFKNFDQLKKSILHERRFNLTQHL